MSMASNALAQEQKRAEAPSPPARRRFDLRFLPLAATISLFVLMSLIGGSLYEGFLSPQVFLNLLIDNSFLIIVAVGMTFVILTGGIDLSVGSVVALTTMVMATLVEHHHWSFWSALPVVLLMGASFGAFMGFLIERYRLQSFIVTLAGMFLARGVCYLISIDSISISDEPMSDLALWRWWITEDASISLSAVIALACVIVAVWIGHSTSFGRTVYAIGGNEQSAILMGLPVRRTIVAVYALSGLCSALGGVTFTLYMLSGYGLHANGMELDAIAAVVIGGTLLTGGVGYVFGSLFGVLMLGLIQTLIAFDGSLSSWWTRIFVGMLLFVFCLLQRLLTRKADSSRAG